jgi:hypothetical protein
MPVLLPGQNIPFKYAPFTPQTCTQDGERFPASVAFASARATFFGSLAAARPGSRRTQCIQPRHTVAWKVSSEYALSPSIAFSRGGISFVKGDLVDSDAAVGGRSGGMYVATWASERAVRARPIHPSQYLM